MKNKKNLLLLSGILHFTTLLHSTITWEKTPYGEITGTEDTALYTYDLNTVINTKTFTGSLTKTDTVSWCYDAHMVGDQKPGSWAWRINDTTWQYDYQKQTWSLKNGVTQWQKTTVNLPTTGTFEDFVAWKNPATISLWSLCSTLTEWGVVPENSTWINHISRPFNIDTDISFFLSKEFNTQYQTFKEGWQKVDTDWVCLSFEDGSYRWRFNAATLEWTRINVASGDGLSLSNETWRIAADGETITHIVSGTPNTTWHHQSLNTWVNESTNDEWTYLSSGLWKNNTTEEEWEYDATATTTGMWEKTTDDEHAYLPPLLPPLVVLQYQEITEVLALAQDAAAGAITTNPDSIRAFELPNRNLTLDQPLPVTIKQDGTNFIVNNSVGRGTLFGFQADSAFEAPNGERWQYSANNPDMGDEIEYENMSDNIALADSMMHNPSTDKWWHKEAIPSHKWQYNVHLNQWYNSGTGVSYLYDHTTNQWTESSEHDVWEYMPDATHGWIWKNITLDETWVYKNHPNETSGACWWHAESDTYWQPSGTDLPVYIPPVYGPGPEEGGWYEPVIVTPGYVKNNNAHLTNVDTNEEWEYNSTTKLWHPVSTPESDGIALFPLLPSSMAGYSGLMAYTAIHETTSASTILPGINGLLNRLQNLEQQKTELLDELEALNTLTGTAAYEKRIKLLRDATILDTQFNELKNEFYRIYNPYNKPVNFQVPKPVPGSGNGWFYGDCLFQEWIPTQCCFHTPGKGMFTFKISNTSSYVRIGLATTTATDSPPEYILLCIPNPETGRSFQLIKGGSTTDEERLLGFFLPDQDLPQITNNTTFWCIYENGIVSLYIDSLEHKISSSIYTILPEANDILYYSFCGGDFIENPFIEVTSYPPYSVTTIIDNANLINEIKLGLSNSITKSVFNNITWEKTVLGNVSGTQASTTYTLDYTELFDSENISGALTKNNNDNATHWAYDAYTPPTAISGDWSWIDNDNSWKYNRITNTWKIDGAHLHEWKLNGYRWVENFFVDPTPICTWDNAKRGESWSLEPANSEWGAVQKNSTWAHHLALTDANYLTALENYPINISINYIKKGWQYQDGDWVSLDAGFEMRTQRWHFNPTTSIWHELKPHTIELDIVLDGGKPKSIQYLDGSFLLTSEQWYCNPLTETMTCLNDDAEANQWRQSVVNYWIEEVSGKIWQSTSTAWYNVDEDNWYSYDQDVTAGPAWKNQTTNEYKYLPPMLPPRVVTQYHEIQNILSEAQTTLSNPATDNPENIHPFELPGRDIALSSPLDAEIALSDTAFMVNDSGRGEIFGFNADFETPNEEKWTIIVAQDESEYFENSSTNIQLADTVFYHAATDCWWRLEDNTSHKWVYVVATNSWINRGTTAQYEYDITTNTWQHIDGTDSWQYQQHSPEGWAWYNTSTEHHWIYKTHPNNTSGACWWDKESDEYWQPTGTELTPQLYNITTDTIWSYNPTTKLWHEPSFPSTQGAQLFPLLPPTVAAYAGQMAYTALTEIHSTSTSMPAIQGTIHRFEELAALFESEITAFEELKETASQNDIAAALPTVMQSFYFIQKTYLQLLEEYQQLYQPYATNNVFIPTSNNTFEVWAPAHCYFDTPGSGLFSFNIKELVSEFSIGFATAPTTDGTAEYALIFTALNDDLTDYSITLKQGATTLSTLESWVPSEISVVDFWCMITANTLSLRAHTKKNEIFNYTFSENLTLQYYTFTSPDEPQISSTTYPPHSEKLELNSADYYNYIQDSNNFSFAELAWVQGKEKLNNIVTSLDGYELKRRNGRDLVHFLFGTYSNAQPLRTINNAYQFNGFLSEQYAERIRYLDESMNGIKSSTEIFYEYADNLLALEATLNAILTAQPALLSEEQQQALIDATVAAANDLLDIFIGGELEQIQAMSNAVYAWPDNADILSFKNFIEEEKSLLTQLKSTFLLISPLVVERFKQQIILFADSSPETQTIIAEQEALREANKAVILNLLATETAKGNTTLFAAAFAAAITFCLNAKFDSMRNTISNYLEDNNYTDVHVFREENPTPSSSTINGIYEQLQTILRDVEPLINLNGNLSFPEFKGVGRTSQDSSAAVYLHSSLSAAQTQTDVTQQQQDIEAGVSDYLKNTLATTAAQDTTRNVIREFTIPNRAKTEAFSRIYIKDALVALGNGNLSSRSGSALSVLGAAEITPDGNSIITLNSDIVISGQNFLRPSKDFGNDTENATRCIPAVPPALRGKHEIIFYSDVERSITITSGTDFDLTAFAQGLVTNGQRIVFAGKVKLIFEPNTRFRLPYTQPNQRDYGLTVAFKDDAQLVFQGAQNYDTARWTSAMENTDPLCAKILGVGTLEFSGNAQARILESAIVGLEADYTSNVTDIVVTLNDNSGWFVGDEDTVGGSFHVGNVTNNGSNTLDPEHYPNTTSNPLFGDIDNPFTPRHAQVDFTLNLFGSNSRFVIGQNGFVGFAVGTVNKFGPINGTLPNNSTNPTDDTENEYHVWSMHGLYNVGNITLNLINGKFIHNIIATGSAPEASLLAFGPIIPRSNYQLTLNKQNSTGIVGGGNVMLFRDQHSLPYESPEDAIDIDTISIDSTPEPIAVWDTVLPLVGDSTDNGKHSILAPIPIIISRQKKDTATSGIKRYGRAAIQETTTGYRFTGPLDEFYLAMTFQKLANNNRHVLTSLNGQVPSYTLVDSNGVITSGPIVAKKVLTTKRRPVKPTRIASDGFLRTGSTTARPRSFIKTTQN